MDQKELAKILLRLKAVNLSPKSPFTWASGLQSPIYCDNRLIISSVAERNQVIDAFVSLIQSRFPQTQVVAGTATAGIPHAAWIADRLGLPMVYVRSSEKQHGKRNQIEGRLEAASRVLVVEDLISTGGSSIKAVQALREGGAQVEGVIAIFQYGFAEAAGNFQKASVPYSSLTDLKTLLAVAAAEKQITAEELQLLEEWQQDPKKWSSDHSH